MRDCSLGAPSASCWRSDEQRFQGDVHIYETLQNLPTTRDSAQKEAGSILLTISQEGGCSVARFSPHNLGTGNDQGRRDR